MTLSSSKSEFLIKDGIWKNKKLWNLYEKAQTPFFWQKKLFECGTKSLVRKGRFFQKMSEKCPMFFLKNPTPKKTPRPAPVPRPIRPAPADPPAARALFFYSGDVHEDCNVRPTKNTSGFARTTVCKNPVGFKNYCPR